MDFLYVDFKSYDLINPCTSLSQLKIFGGKIARYLNGKFLERAQNTQNESILPIFGKFIQEKLS